MYFDQYLRKSWFLVSKFFVKKITPAPKKLMLWRVYVKFSIQTCFVVCTGCQASTITHNFRHYLCMFVNAGFQNLGKLNTGMDVLLCKYSPLLHYQLVPSLETINSGNTGNQNHHDLKVNVALFTYFSNIDFSERKPADNAKMVNIIFPQ